MNTEDENLLAMLALKFRLEQLQQTVLEFAQRIQNEFSILNEQIDHLQFSINSINQDKNDQDKNILQRILQ